MDVPRDEYEVIKSQKGNDLISYSGFTYFKNKQNKDKSYWRCAYYQKNGCKCRVTVNKDQSLNVLGTHSHLPDLVGVTVRKVVNQIKFQASYSTDNPQDILDTSVQSLEDSLKPALPNTSTLRRSIQKIRKRKSRTVAEPKSASTTITEELKHTLSGETFLFYDNQDNLNRILIFASASSLNLLSESQDWFLDATFTPIPSNFSQLFTIHVSIGTTIVPVVYALLPNRHQETYDFVFDHVLSNVSALCFPNRIVLDIDPPIVNSVMSRFVTSHLKGSYFHLSQVFFRKISEYENTYRRYSSDIEFTIRVKMILGIAFVPLCDVFVAFSILKEDDYYVENIDDIGPIMDFFEEYFIGMSIDGIRKPPIFSPQIWNLYLPLMERETWCSVNVEVWHNRFRKFVKSDNPGLMRFVQSLREDESVQSFAFQQNDNGVSGNILKKAYKDLNERIRNVAVTYDSSLIIQYLRNVAHTFTI